jgi:hypothetical protein
LRHRETIVENLLVTIRGEIRRTEEGLPSLIEDDGYWLGWARPGVDLQSTIGGEHDERVAAKLIASAIERLSMLADGEKSWEWGLEQALHIATLELAPGIEPVARLNEICATADKNRVAREDVARLLDPEAFVPGRKKRRERALTNLRQKIMLGHKNLRLGPTRR